jgi:hypothetical protein
LSSKSKFADSPSIFHNKEKTMPEPTESRPGVIGDIVDNFSAVLRLLLPGVLVLGTAFAAHPKWFENVNLYSWTHLAVAAVFAVVAGNILFVFNRYGVLQIIDFILYILKVPGPTKKSSMNYHADLARYVRRSLIAPDIPRSARQHISFRVGGVMLMYTFSELTLAFSISNESGSFFSRHICAAQISGCLIFLVGFWQNIITRRIDNEMTVGDRG